MAIAEVNEARQFLSTLGSPSHLVLMTVVILTLIKVWPIIQKNVYEARTAKRGEYNKRITDLENALQACREDCDARDDEAKREIRSLHDELFGLRKQHMQEQISFARAILDSLGRESPQLSVLLTALEN